MKKLIFLAVFLFCLSVNAENQKENIDWSKIERRLYEDLKEEGNKGEAEIYQIIGYSLMEVDNQWERATVYFKKAVDIDPSLYFSWYNLGLIYIDDEEGCEYFKKTIEAKPDFVPPYYWIAYNYCRHYRDIEAIPAWEKYLEVAELKNEVNEQGRINTARKVLKELKSGRAGDEAKKIRHPMPEEYVFEKAYLNEGNIYFVDKEGKERQFTVLGKDSEMILSPNKKQIVFVRQVQELKDNPYGIPETDAEIEYGNWSPYEIWTIDVNNGESKVLLKSYYKKGVDTKENRGWFYSHDFSPDGNKLYYACQPGCPTTHAIHSVNADGTEDKWLHWGESVKVIEDKEEEYCGYLIVRRGADDGAYDITVIMTPEGKEIGLFEEIYRPRG